MNDDSKCILLFLQTENIVIMFFSFMRAIIFYFSYKDTPGLPLRYSYDGILKDLLVYCKPKCPKKLFYQILSIKVNELDNKKQFKCLWVSLYIFNTYVCLLKY